MAFGITENTTSYFVNNDTVLPRFQRKATWKDDDNFKLCISVFKGYPIGVVIINEIVGQKYLLDGRQRRNALLRMYENPVDVYKWAKHFLKLKDNMSDEEVRSKFSEKISDYLQSEFDKATEDSTEGIIGSEPPSDEDDEDDAVEGRTFDAGTQTDHINALLDLILMVHGKYASTNKFEGIFKFKSIIPESELDYSRIENGNDVIDPIELKRYIKELIRKQITTKDSLLEHLSNRHHLDARNKNKLNQYLNDQWAYIDKCFSTIKKTDSIIINAQIGLIRLIDASPLDAQNIFSLVNGGGAKLTAEELLSSRPYWNVQIESPSNDVKDEARKLYEFLEIEVPSNVVRWDVCASLLSRIDKDHLIFENFDSGTTDAKAKDTLFTKKLTLGFKLISALKVGGISSISVKELENERKVQIDWDRDIETFISEFNLAVDLLADYEYFKYLKAWNQSVMSLLGNSVSLEFATLIYQKWVDLGKPRRSNGSVVKKFQKAGFVLFDRLIYEYSSRLWAGSGDSRLARDLEDVTSRFTVVSTDDWKKVIKTFEEGKNPSVVKGIIYHYYCLKKMRPVLDGHNVKYDIDHIYAQAQFGTTATIDKALMESLGNKALLPKGDNIAKSDRPLNALTGRNDTWLLAQVKYYTGIKDNEIEKYSNINNLSKLIEKRIKDYNAVFKDNRNNFLNN